MTARPDLRLLRASLDGREHVIDIADGRIAAIRAAHEPMPEAARLIDLAGALVLPGLTDAHVHLDKCLLGLPWRPHRAAGSVRARIEDEKAFRRDNRIPLAEQGATALLERMLRGGTTSLRTHVDIDDVTGLGHLAQILDLRAQWADRMRIEIVAFPQSGILACPPVAALLDEALRMGADLVGGLDPHGIDGDAQAPLDIVFGLAERHGRAIDIHLHDGGEAGLSEIEAIIARTEAGASAGGSRSATPSPWPMPTTRASGGSPRRWRGWTSRSSAACRAGGAARPSPGCGNSAWRSASARTMCAIAGIPPR